MNTFELLKELLKKSSDEINYGILVLMLKGKLDFNRVNAAYVESLERLRKDNKLLLAEKDLSIYDLLSSVRKESKTNHNAVHRALYNLNESNAFNMQDINEKFGYDKEKDCKLSMYWREHEHDYNKL